MKALMWPVATYGCESWTVRKNQETRLDADAFETKGLRTILRVSWTAKNTNEWWVLNKARVKRELLDTVKARRLVYYGHDHEETRELPGKRDNVTNNVRCMDRTPRGRVNQNVRGKERTSYYTCIG